MIKNFLSFFKSKKRIIFVESLDDQNSFIEKIKNQNILGLDTEFDWRSTYLPVLSLLQISTSKNIFIVDFLNFKKVKKLKEILENKDILKILHSSRNDSTIMSNCLDIFINNVFDVQQAEKLISNGEIFNYGHLVQKYFGIHLEKSETNSNWLKRPLSDDQMKYASDDVNYLMEIFNAQKKILTNNQLKKIFELSQKEISNGNERLDKSRLKKRKNKLTPLGKEIFLWRENLAKIENIPPNYVFKENYLNSLEKLTKEDKKKCKKKVLKIIGDSKYSRDFISKFV
tara:strand:- start:858 stop:1712 length:855 start_codon:yes stop_codon:yes gene_type:complete